MRIVVAIGDSLVPDAPSLRELRAARVPLAGSRLADVAARHDLVITLGSGLQQAALEVQAAEGNEPQTSQPPAISGLSRELLLGHLFRQELANALPADKPTASILTTTEVDPRDPAFDEPTATVGPSYDEWEAARISEQQEWALRPSVDPIQMTSVLAIDIDADQLLITTVRDVDGSLPAEFQAADEFTRTTGHATVLGDLADLPCLLAGTTGTQITLSAPPRESPGRSATVSPLSRTPRT